MLFREKPVKKRSLLPLFLVSAGLATTFACSNTTQGESSPVGGDGDAGDGDAGSESGDGDSGLGGAVGDGDSEVALDDLEVDVPERLLRSLVWNVEVDETFGAGGEEGIWTIEEGSLPDGLSLSSDGRLSGSATELGSFSVSIQVENSGGRKGVVEIELVVESRSWVAYLVFDGEADGYSLGLTDLAPALPVRVSLAEGEASYITNIQFSHDGKSLVFEKHTAESDRCELNWVDLSGPSPRAHRVGEGHFRCYTGKWSPDGKAFATVQHLGAGGAAPVELVPAVVRFVDGAPMVAGALAADAEDSFRFKGWLGNDKLLASFTGGAALVFDVEEDVVSNPRSVGAVTDVWFVDPIRQQYTGWSTSGSLLVNLPGAWSAALPSALYLSPGLGYAYDYANDRVENVYKMEALRDEPLVPTRLIGESFLSNHGPRVWFVGEGERYLFAYDEPLDAPARFWGTDLESEDPVSSGSAPCSPIHIEGTPWFSCSIFGDSPQIYAHRAGRHDAFHELVPATGFDSVGVTVAAAPHRSELLFTATDDVTGLRGVYVAELLEDGVLSRTSLVSPLDQADAKQAYDSGADLAWTGDGMFSVYVMAREVGGAAALSSYGVWATQRGQEEPTPFNASQTNEHCFASETFPSGNSCKRLESIHVQPPVVD